MKIFKVVMFGALFIGIAIGCYYLFGNFSTGSRAGTVIKLSKKGVIFKTYEGQLNLGVLGESMENQQGNVVVSNLWDFSVGGGKQNVIDTLERAMLTGQRVNLRYHEKFEQYFWRGDTKYFVYEVEVLK